MGILTKNIYLNNNEQHHHNGGVKNNYLLLPPQIFVPPPSIPLSLQPNGIGNTPINRNGIANSSNTKTVSSLSEAASLAINGSTEDPNYHAALLEAYNRGVEAATALSSSNNGCCNSDVAAGIPIEMINTSNTMLCNDSNTNLSSAATTATSLSQMSCNIPQQVASMPMISTASSFPSSNNNITTDQYLLQQQTSNESIANMLSQQQHLQQLQLQSSEEQQRCKSLPNLTTQTEEFKRKKRLERNRTSAKLRRAKKKNLIDTYKNEFSALESSLEKLSSHQWGSSCTTSSNELLEALSMERIVINNDEKKNNVTLSCNDDDRKCIIYDLLQDQLDYMNILLESYKEIMTLRWFLLYSTSENHSANLTSEEEEIIKELKECLFTDNNNMSNEQCIQLLESTQDIEKEYDIVYTIHETITTLLSSKDVEDEENRILLYHPFIEDTIKQFYSIMNHSQITKFLLWNDYNYDSIDCLDYVNANAAAATNIVENNNVYDDTYTATTSTFGMDSMKQQEQQQLKQPNFMFNFDNEKC